MGDLKRTGCGGRCGRGRRQRLGNGRSDRRHRHLVVAGATGAAVAVDGRFLRRECGSVVDAAEINVAGGEECFAGRIIALPNDIEHVAPGARGKIHREPEIAALEIRGHGIRNRLEMVPTQRLRGIIALLGDVHGEGTRLMRRGGIEHAVVRPRLHRRGRPIGPRQINAGKLGQSRAGQLAVGNEVAVVALRHEPGHFVPRVERRGSRNSHGRAGGGARRVFRIFQEDLVNTADRIGHGSVGESV